MESRSNEVARDTIGSGRVAPSQRRWLAAVMRVLNLAPSVILRSPLHGMMSGDLMLLEFSGRKSGKPYVVPISYREEGEALILGTDRPWRHNIRNGDRLDIWLKGRRREVTAEIVDGVAEMTTLFGIIVPKNPAFGHFMDLRLDTDGRPNGDDLRRAFGRGLIVIRLHPA